MSDYGLSEENEGKNVMVNVTPIYSDQDYRNAIKRIEVLIEFAQEDSVEEQELDVLVALVEAWEEEHYPVEFPDVITAIEFALDQQGMTQKDLATLIGANRASEVLNGKRTLSLAQVALLWEKLKVPPEIFLADVLKKTSKRQDQPV